MKRSIAAYAITMFLLMGLFTGGFVAGAAAQANVQGQWTTLANTMPINPVHVALLYTGKILVVSGSGNVAGNTNFQAGVWDPQTNTIATQPVAWDMFCNGMVVLPDGRPFINGGTLQYDPFHGELRSSVYDPSTNTFTDVQNMAHGRWYPTVTTLGDGRVMTFSGLLETGGTNTAVEIYTVGSGWSQQYAASWTPPTYPRMHLLPNGRVFYSGPGTQSRLFNPTNQTWTNVAVTNYSGTRTYGTSILLPLTPANNYDPKVMILGGGTTATKTTEIIDLGASSPVWDLGPDMSQARTEMNAVILPSGKILALGGSAKDEDGTTASLNADLYDPDPAVNTFSSAGANAFPRLYHSVALLLPDATVWLAGGNPQRGTYEQHVEIYQPAYLFTTDLNGNSVLAPRPTISAAPSSVTWSNSFTVQTPDAANISSVVLVRNGAVTHAFDMDQRLVGLSFTAGSGALTVTAPPNGNIAPPGYYMLFLVNSSGVPSVAKMIQIGQQPDFSLAATPSSQTVVQGNGTSYNVSITPSGGFSGTVSFSVSGLPQGASASFNPTSINTSGSTTLSISTSGSTPAGSYSLVITGSSGSLSHTATVTLNVNAPSDFSISTTPASQTITAGSPTSYSVTISPLGGFSGTVSFSISGLPQGASASFNPTSVNTSGSTTLGISTSGSTPAGNYSLVITGSSGSLSHTATVTLNVNAPTDFSISATPASQTITRGSRTSYTVTISPIAGFTGTVSLSVTGLPPRTSGKFNPSSIIGSGSSTLTVFPNKNAPRGTYTLTITGSSGGVSHSTAASLTIQ